MPIFVASYPPVPSFSKVVQCYSGLGFWVKSRSSGCKFFPNLLNYPADRDSQQVESGILEGISYRTELMSTIFFLSSISMRRQSQAFYNMKNWADVLCFCFFFLPSRSIRRHSQAFNNRTGLMSLSKAPPQLKVVDFLSSYKKPQPPVNLRPAKMPQTTDMWRQRPRQLTVPSRVDVSGAGNVKRFIG